MHVEFRMRTLNFNTIANTNMNTFPTPKTLSRGLMALALVALGSSALPAAELDARIQLRPLTPQEIKDYSLGDAQRSGGLSTVGLGQPGYVDVLVNIDVPASENVTVSFSATNEFGMQVALEPSPLGANVPPYAIEDREGGEFAAQVVGRTMLRPAVQGRYTVVATIDSATDRNIRRIGVDGIPSGEYFTLLEKVRCPGCGAWITVAPCVACHLISGRQCNDERLAEID